MIYLKLFLSFLQIGLFSFGGGYAAMPLIQEQVVTQHGWLTMTEFTDLITISQMTPGPIAINAATFVGSKIAGVPGSVAATCGCILPSCIIVTLIAWFYLRYKKMKMFQNVLEYKLLERGKHFVKVDKWFPSSQICHCCGHQQPMPLKIRVYQCPECGMVFDRDWNAAINIKLEGLRLLTA